MGGCNGSQTQTIAERTAGGFAEQAIASAHGTVAAQNPIGGGCFVPVIHNE